MGRIKTSLIKRVTFDLIRQHKEKLKDDFEYNKLAVNQLTTVQSFKLRNKIAGYITRLMKSPDNLMLKVK